MTTPSPSSTSTSTLPPEQQQQQEQQQEQQQQKQQQQQPRRIGQLVYLKPEYLEEYKRCHAAVWPDVLAQLKASNIADYSIYLTPHPRPTLFASFKYVGDDWDADMAAMAANARVRAWWEMTDRMQESPLPGAKGSYPGPWWLGMEEVFWLE